jgi:hypothetical protein
MIFMLNSVKGNRTRVPCGAGAGFPVARSYYRLAMYIVISKPKRRSVNAGVVQFMIELLK